MAETSVEFFALPYLIHLSISKEMKKEIEGGEDEGEGTSLEHKDQTEEITRKTA